MVSGAISRKALEHKIHAARVVQEWKKRSKGKRESLSKLAARIGLTLSKTRTLANSRPKKQDVAREKVRLIREAARRVTKPVRRCEVSTKLAKDCKIHLLSPRTVSRVRKPYREQELVLKAAKIEENKRRADLSQGSCGTNVVLNARLQGW